MSVSVRTTAFGNWPAIWENQTMNKSNPKVDGFLKACKKWREEMTKLRAIALSNPHLAEDMKWRFPCYTFEDGNIVLIHAFKEYCALLFFKGALLKDPKGILIQQTENVQAGRQIRFTSVQQIARLEPAFNAYIREAIDAEKRGLKIELKKTSEFTIPEELQTKFDEMAALKAAFAALTPGRQRGYILHISSARQSKTRTARVEKWTPHILDGKGMDDQ
jgi:uncharacterized protein YdeI (YjbR/CyaY-like superfamily)